MKLERLFRPEVDATLPATSEKPHAPCIECNRPITRREAEVLADGALRAAERKDNYEQRRTCSPECAALMRHRRQTGYGGEARTIVEENPGGRYDSHNAPVRRGPPHYVAQPPRMF